MKTKLTICRKWIIGLGIFVLMTSILLLIHQLRLPSATITEPELLAYFQVFKSFIERNTDFIQGVESSYGLLVILVSVLTFLLWQPVQFFYKHIQKRASGSNVPAEPALLHQVTLSEMSRMRKSSEVKWINRYASEVTNLERKKLLIFLGPPGLGKTREAIELIRHAVDFEVISEKCIFKTGNDFRNLRATGMMEVLRRTLPPYDEKVLLFIEDLHSDSPKAPTLDLLEVTIRMMKENKEAYVIATAREEPLTAEHWQWLDRLGFTQIKLPLLQPDKIRELVQAAQNVYKLNFDQDALDEFEKLEGLPGPILDALCRLDQGSTISRDTAVKIVNEIHSNTWQISREHIIEKVPYARTLLNALASFHAANIETYRRSVLRYGGWLEWGLAIKRWWKIWYLNETLERLSRSSNYIHIEMGSNRYTQTIKCEDEMIEGLIAPDKACQELSAFFSRNWLFTRASYQLRLRHKYEAEIQQRLLFGLAVKYHEWKQYDKAISLYQKASQLYPNFEIYNSLGNVCFEAGEMESALSAYNRTTELNPDYPIDYLRRGMVYYELTQYANAINDFEVAAKNNDSEDAHKMRWKAFIQLRSGDIIQNPRSLGSYIDRGDAYCQIYNYDSAIQDYSTAIELGDKNFPEQWSNAFYRRGKAYLAINKLDLALADFNNGIELYNANAEVYKSCGDVLYALGELRQAITNYTIAINLDMRDARAFSKRGICYQTLGEYDNARKDYLHSLKLDPNRVDPFIGLGDIDTEANRFDEAITNFETAAKHAPENALTAFKLGRNYHSMYRLGEFTDTVIETAQAELKSNPGFSDLKSEDKNEQIKQKATQIMFTHIISNLNKAIKLKPNFVDAYLKRGDVWLDKEEARSAIEDYQKAIELSPQNANAHFSLGAAFREKYKSSDSDGIDDQLRAKEAYSKAIDLDPTRLDFYWNHGLICIELNQRSEAEADLREIEKIADLETIEAFRNQLELIGENELHL